MKKLLLLFCSTVLLMLNANANQVPVNVLNSCDPGVINAYNAKEYNVRQFEEDFINKRNIENNNIEIAPKVIEKNVPASQIIIEDVQGEIINPDN